MDILLSLRSKAQDAAEQVLSRVIPGSSEGRSLAQMHEGIVSSSQVTSTAAGLEQHFEVFPENKAKGNSKKRSVPSGRRGLAHLGRKLVELDGTPLSHPYFLNDGGRRLTESKKRSQSRLHADEQDIWSSRIGACVAACVEEGDNCKDRPARNLSQVSDPALHSLPWIPVNQTRDSTRVGNEDSDRCALPCGKVGEFPPHELTWTEEMAACRIACERSSREQQKLERGDRKSEFSWQQMARDSRNPVDSGSPVPEVQVLSSGSQMYAMQSARDGLSCSGSGASQDSPEMQPIDSAYGFSFGGSGRPQADGTHSDAVATDGRQGRERGPRRGRGKKGGAREEARHLCLSLPHDPRVAHEASGMEADAAWHHKSEFEYVSPRRAKLLRVGDEQQNDEPAVVRSEKRDSEQVGDSAEPHSRPLRGEKDAPIVDLPHAVEHLQDPATAAAEVAAQMMARSRQGKGSRMARPASAPTPFLPPSPLHAIVAWRLSYLTVLRHMQLQWQQAVTRGGEGGGGGGVEGEGIAGGPVTVLPLLLQLLQVGKARTHTLTAGIGEQKAKGFKLPFSFASPSRSPASSASFSPASSNGERRDDNNSSSNNNRDDRSSSSSTSNSDSNSSSTQPAGPPAGVKEERRGSEGGGAVSESAKADVYQDRGTDRDEGSRQEGGGGYGGERLQGGDEKKGGRKVVFAGMMRRERESRRERDGERHSTAWDGNWGGVNGREYGDMDDRSAVSELWGGASAGASDGRSNWWRLLQGRQVVLRLRDGEEGEGDGGDGDEGYGVSASESSMFRRLRRASQGDSRFELSELREMVEANPEAFSRILDSMARRLLHVQAATAAAARRRQSLSLSSRFSSSTNLLRTSLSLSLDPSPFLRLPLPLRLRGVCEGRPNHPLTRVSLSPEMGPVRLRWDKPRAWPSLGLTLHSGATSIVQLFHDQQERPSRRTTLMLGCWSRSQHYRSILALKLPSLHLDMLWLDLPNGELLFHRLHGLKGSFFWLLDRGRAVLQLEGRTGDRTGQGNHLHGGLTVQLPWGTRVTPAFELPSNKASISLAHPIRWRQLGPTARPGGQLKFRAVLSGPLHERGWEAEVQKFFGGGSLLTAGSGALPASAALPPSPPRAAATASAPALPSSPVSPTAEDHSSAAAAAVSGNGSSSAIIIRSSDSSSSSSSSGAGGGMARVQGGGSGGMAVGVGYRHGLSPMAFVSLTANGARSRRSAGTEKLPGLQLRVEVPPSHPSRVNVAWEVTAGADW